MLSKSLDVIDHEEWIAELGDAFGSHIPMYNRYSEEKVGPNKKILVFRVT